MMASGPFDAQLYYIKRTD